MNTKEKITLGAVQMFVKHGVAGTTTREIALCAGVAEGSLYRYFPSKDELAWQIFSDYHQHVATCLAESAKDEKTVEQQVHALVSCFFKLADENWLMFQYYLTAQHMFMHRIDNSKNNPYQVIISIIIQKKNEEPSENIKITAAMAMGAVQQVALNKLYGRIKGNLFKYVELVTDTVYQIVTKSTKAG